MLGIDPDLMQSLFSGSVRSKLVRQLPRPEQRSHRRGHVPILRLPHPDRHFSRPHAQKWVPAVGVVVVCGDGNDDDDHLESPLSVFPTEASRHSTGQFRRLGRCQLGFPLGNATAAATGSPWSVTISETSNTPRPCSRRRSRGRCGCHENSGLEAACRNSPHQLSPGSSTGQGVCQHPRWRPSHGYHR